LTTELDLLGWHAQGWMGGSKTWLKGLLSAVQKWNKGILKSNLPTGKYSPILIA
jgi:hypothetical protein